MAKPESEPKTPLGARLRLVRNDLGNLDREEFAAALGVSKNTLAYYERGERTPDADVLAAYREQFKVNINWMVSGEGTMFQAQSTNSTVQVQARSKAASTGEDDEDGREIVRLPRYDVRASAGRGLIPISAMPVGEVAFARAFLRRLGGNPDHCYALEASGDSMWPTIEDGDLMIADGSQTEIDDGRIYHFNAGERVLVKRARWAMDGRLRLTSDNTAAGYPDEVIGPDTAHDYRAGGRIIFAGGSPPPVR